MESSLPFRLVAVIEAASVTGPAKNLIGFCRWLQGPDGVRAGVRASIVTFERTGGEPRRNGLVEAASAAGVDIHLVRERFRFDPGVAWRLCRVVGELRPDIIETHNNKSHLLVKVMPRLRANRLWFAYHHGYIYPDLKQRIYNHVDGFTLRGADRVLTVCEAFRPTLQGLGVAEERIRILHNSAVPLRPVFDAESRALRERLRIGTTDSVILSIGRLSREKGHRELCRALGNLRSSHAGWKLILVGEGPERKSLQELAGSLGIEERVIFAGYHPQVAAFYAIADVVVLPSLSEGSSNVLLEAMMAGLPIVATRVGGNPEIVIDEATGLLVSPGDPGALANALDRLLNDRSLAVRLGEAARSRVSAEFSPERYRERLLSFYEQALQEN